MTIIFMIAWVLAVFCSVVVISAYINLMHKVHHDDLRAQVRAATKRNIVLQSQVKEQAKTIGYLKADLEGGQ